MFAFFLASVTFFLLPMPAYFTDDLFRFLTRLKRNNNREWFWKHKAEFDEHGRDAALRFIHDFAGPLYEISPHLVADARPSRGSLFRIYRDTRFAADKRPYKTHLAMHFSHPGKDVHSPGFYLHLEPGGSFAAAGLWHPEPPLLLKVRTAMVQRVDEWRKVRHLLTWDDAGKLTRPPRGFPFNYEFLEDLKYKDIGSSIEFTDKQVTSPRFMQTFTKACKDMAPLAKFLSSAAGLKF
jgi:uncharacterized protein (TIGR02453 family)